MTRKLETLEQRYGIGSDLIAELLLAAERDNDSEFVRLCTEALSGDEQAYKACSMVGY